MDTAKYILALSIYIYEVACELQSKRFRAQVTLAVLAAGGGPWAGNRTRHAKGD